MLAEYLGQVVVVDLDSPYVCLGTLTRADERLLRSNASDIARFIPKRAAVIELGSGVGKKTRHLLRAIGERSLTSLTTRFQGHRALSFSPSRLPSPFASLCFSL